MHIIIILIFRWSGESLSSFNDCTKNWCWRWFVPFSEYLRALPETTRLFDRRCHERKTFSRHKWKRIPSELICVVCDIKKKKIQQKSRKKQNRNKTAKNNHVVKSYVNWFVLLRVRSLFIEMFLTISWNMWSKNYAISR